MDGLFELLFENPFLLILIVGWLFAMFRDKPAEEERKQQQRQRPRPVQSSRSTTRTSRVDEAKSEGRTPLGKIDVEKKPVIETNQETEPLTIEEQRLEQLAQLQDRLGTRTYRKEEATSNVTTAFGKQNRTTKPYKKVNSSRLSKRLKQEGLIESIIMAEILGKPRAKRSHHRDYL